MLPPHMFSHTVFPVFFSATSTHPNGRSVADTAHYTAQSDSPV